jgi:hypothetical protein
MLQVADWLEREGASHDVVEWARPYGADMQRLWAECPRGDWLIALALRLGAEHRLLVRAACGCARLALSHLPDSEQRPAAAVRAAEAWSAGELDADACAAHKQAAAQALDQTGDPAAAAAGIAAQCALDAIWDAEAAVSAAAYAAQAAVLATGDCAMLEALNFTQRKSAQLVRASIPAEQAGALFLARAAVVGSS